jgi:predicted nucleic acid-binding protein
MPRLFFDTSALVKRYYEEAGSETVDELVEAEGNEVVITSLSVVETASALRRKQNRGEITSRDVDRLLGAFFEEALDEFVVLPVDESFSGTALDLVLEADLRTLDSLQLAAALSISSDTSGPVFVCANRDLVDVAARRGLETQNPESS